MSDEAESPDVSFFCKHYHNKSNTWCPSFRPSSFLRELNGGRVHLVVFRTQSWWRHGNVIHQQNACQTVLSVLLKNKYPLLFLIFRRHSLSSKAPMWFESPITTGCTLSYPIFFAIILECFVCRVLTIKWNFITWAAVLSVTKPQHTLVVNLWYYTHSPQKYSFEIFIAFQGFLLNSLKTVTLKAAALFFFFTNKNHRHVGSSYLNLSFHTNSPLQSAIKRVEINIHGRIMVVFSGRRRHFAGSPEEGTINHSMRCRTRQTCKSIFRMQHVGLDLFLHNKGIIKLWATDQARGKNPLRTHSST